MLLNYKHYFITILNILLGSVFSSGSKNEDKPDVIETIDQRLANDNRNSGLRSPVDPRRHRRQRRVMRPTDVARSVRRLQRHCTYPNWILFQVDREVFAPTGQKNRNFRRICAMLRVADIAVIFASLLLPLSRYVCAYRSVAQWSKQFLTIGDYDDRKSADAFPFYHAQLNRRTLGARTSQRQKPTECFHPLELSEFTLNHISFSHSAHIFPAHTTLGHYAQST